ncbi:F-box/FBD/LRR-repeat protein At1g13570-like [Malania oleifera]|uniref:F-box/FBD/LRR-repeat protein At1g13570-like n=1 Tax=Malania oleifera TaxID=397392 RepID=UPI0025ADD19B|nr:F-box/FBD/LRR-repeat protein At1g13570-like [Malania oleifera]XP_057974677.1 F-box/FBD/LRR-repeat protein At1g13570-like [Malania oleifera]XP_057974678.1 F-box/FBD/LRR-repeat protein At1g13570-like [Malania oleifera]XP_057974679.1 F-box/FBD/LRR-repeat protein At1g13570-like [Malania oleifera]
MDRSNMKQREPPKYPGKMDQEQDRISNLPGHVIDKILSQLPIREAVRMSVLSSKWRYKWVTLPDVVFDNQCLSVSSQDQALLKNNLVNIVDHVLLLHTGPISKFKLSHRDLLAITDIDRWILYLSRNSIKEFILEIWKGPRYKMPSCLYSCQNLIHLEVFNCWLRPPSVFGGFRSLKSLDLQHVTLDQDVFQNLISGCPLLERLTLMNFDGFTHLNIHAPNLQFFDIGGVFEDVSFKNTHLLTIISIGLYEEVIYLDDENEQSPRCSNSNNLVRFFSHIPGIQRLEVQSHFLKYLAAGDVPRRLPSPCLYLNYLSLRVDFNNWRENMTALCLFRSSPNLQELEMLARAESADEGVLSEISANFWAEDDHWDCSFDQLRLVKIVGISVCRPLMDFINFLLAKSPVLEKLTVRPASNDGRWELVKELLRFRRASVRAEIIYLDP